MATIKIPQLQRQVFGSGLVQSRANVIDVSSGLESVGRGLDQINQAIEQKKLDEDSVQLAKLQNEAAVQFSDWMKDAQDKWKRGDPDIPQQFTSAFDQWSGAAVGGFKTEKGKKAFAERMDAIRTNMAQSAIGWQAQTNKNLKLIDLSQAADDAQKLAAQNPAIAELMATQFTKDLDGINLSQVDKENVKFKYVNGSAFAAENALLDRAPESWKPDDSRWGWNNLTYEQQERMKARHEALLKQKGAHERDLFDERVKDNTAMYLDGMQPPQEITKDEFVAKYGGEEGPYRFNEYAKARDFGLAVASLQNKTPQEMQRTLAENAPQPGDGYAKSSQRFAALQQAAKSVLDNREKDPGLYSMQSPLVAGAKTPGEQVAMSVSVQRSWGIDNVRPLPKEQASALAQELSKMSGDEISNQFAGMRQQYGKNFDVVLGQLSASGLPAPIAVIGEGMAPRPASLLGSVATAKIEDLKATVPASIKPKEITDALSSEAGDYLLSISQMGGADKRYATLSDSAERLAYVYASQGMSAGDAAKTAWNDVIGNKYELDTKDGVMVRIPKSLRIPKDAILDGMDEAKKLITAEDIEPPTVDVAVFERIVQAKNGINPQSAANKSALAVGGLGGVTPLAPKQEQAVDKTITADDQIKELNDQWAEYVRNKSYWVTDQTDEGAYLYLDGAVVMGADGKPIRKTWQQIADPETAFPKHKKDVGTIYTPSAGGF